MVGKARTLRGCRTCNKRRKICELRRPGCPCCKGDDVICNGYEPQQAAYYEESQQAVQKRESLVQSVAATTPFVLLPSTLQASAAKSIYFDVAWQSLRPAHGVNITYDWIQDLPGVHVNDAPLHNAFAAVSLACLGRQRGDPALIHQSHLAYGKALGRAKDQLSNPATAASDEVLGSVLVLALFETVHGSGSQKLPGMLAHMAGAYDITQLRSASSYANPTGRAVLREMRYHDFFQALARRSKSFLAEDDWLNTPWKGVSKSAEDAILDVIARVPDLLKQSDDFQANVKAGTKTEAIEDLEDSYLEAIKQLVTIRATTLKETYGSTPFSWDERSAIFDSQRDRRFSAMFPSRLRYIDMTSANVEILYSAAQLILCSAMLGVYYVITQASAAGAGSEEARKAKKKDTTPASAAPSDDLGTKLAKYGEMSQKHLVTIVRSLEYCLESGILAASTAVAPIMVTVATLRISHDTRLDYVMELLKRYQKKSGVPLADLVTECSGLRPIVGSNEFMKNYSKTVYKPLRGSKKKPEPVEQIDTALNVLSHSERTLASMLQSRLAEIPVNLTYTRDMARSPGRLLSSS
ncbi:hypothetical protein LTR78_000202 [Recurvomyces mirabilis]|uniref:Zn(2)-C6 fungal-type domain-containing protein n=1 Tax=Recurvomyces mirabilis TaxID=574656 RepID=A0AAE0WWP5_9PEZI|nr:hypothetical protein LTR78_000202 [Recurvomyces mirabilis]KAK5161859.1 ccr4 associated factor [Recurvomyces mirabilis]